MKLAFCIFKYFPYGGLERDFMQILEACRARGHEVCVYTMAWQGDVPAGVKVEIISVRGLRNHTRCASFVKKLRDILTTAAYDVVVGFNRMPGLDVCYAADICFAHNAQHNHGKLYRLTSRYKIYAEFERAVFSPQSKTQIMYIAKQVKQQAIKYYQTPATRFHLLTPGVNVERELLAQAAQLRSQVRMQHNISSEQKLILLVGSNFKLKGVDRALHAMASLPNELREQSLLWVFGKDKPEKYKKLANDLGVAANVKFKGLSNEITKYLLSADLLIHPARREAAGMAIMDAIVCGCPVLVTAACGFAFHVERAKAGLVIPQPFQQQQCDLLLKEMLVADQQHYWKQNALVYAQQQDLFGRDQAVDVIEQARR